MTTTLEKQVHIWLSLSGVETSFSYLEKQLTSHPEYPSAFCITETAQQLGLNAVAVQIEKEQLKEVPTPFLVYLEGDGGHFIVVQNISDTLKKIPDFYTRWTGVLIVAEKARTFLSEENVKKLKEDKQRKIKSYLMLALLVTLFACATFTSVFSPVLVLLVLIGAGLSISIVMHENGYKNFITDQFCSTKNEEDCTAVSQSEKSVLGLSIRLSDLAIIFFSGTTLLLGLTSFNRDPNLFITANSILCLLLGLSIPITFLLIYYQWKVIKRWCRLCLLLTITFWLMFATQIVTAHFTIHIAERPMLLIAFLYLLPSGGWLLIRPLLEANKKLKAETIRLVSFKRNTSLFAAYLRSQQKIDTSFWSHDLQIGNPNADLQLIVVCSPYCTPCASAHKMIHNLLDIYKDPISVVIRFTVKREAIKYADVVKHILQSVVTVKDPAEKIQHTLAILDYWFNEMDLVKLKSKYPVNNPVNVDSILYQHEKWSTHVGIEYTPTLFINGYKLAKPYSAQDLPNLFNFLQDFSPALENAENELVLQY